MIIKYFSDLHMEFMDRHDQMNFIDHLIGDDTPDIMVCAGDLAVGKETIKWLGYIDKEVQVPFIFVSGNHEYYSGQKSVLDEEFRQAQKNFKNVHILIQDTFKHMGITFAGSSGWWDTPMKHHLNALNDFSRIYDIRVNSNGTDWGIADRRFFEKTLQTTERVICVSHNAPSWKSILPQFMNSDINECFANKWDKMIRKHQPIAWIHGHMHNTIEYRIGETEIMCNPYGYDGHETNDDFSWNGYIQIT